MPTTTTRETGLLALLFLLLLGVLPGVVVAQDDDDDDPTDNSSVFDDDPDAEIDPRFEKAQTHHLRGEMEAAFRLYDQILAERPADIATRITYAHMKWKIGALAEAQERFEKAVELMPTHIKARQWLGQLYFHQGDRAHAREQFEAMLELKFIREDVMHSAMLNLAKIELLEENWLAARKHFRKLRADGGKADRKTGSRGLKRLDEALDMDVWGRHDSKRLQLHFSPSVEKYKVSAKREQLGAELDDWIVSTSARLGIRIPDPWHVYIFNDDTECSFKVDRKTAHSWDYSWWLSYIADTSEGGTGPKHTLAVQLSSRWGGSRPLSRSLVEGFCAWLAGEVADPHAPARELYRQRYTSGNRLLPSIVDMHQNQRRQPHYEAGVSYVAFLIDTFGLEKFGTFWKRFNLFVNAPQYKKGISKTIDFEKAFDDLYGFAFETTLQDVESRWHAFLGQ